MCNKKWKLKSPSEGRGEGVLVIFIYGDVRMKSKIHTQKYGFTVNFAPINIVILHDLLPKNMGDNFISIINLIAKNYF